MIEFSKSQKRELRDLADEAYSLELTVELNKLEENFRLLREGQINAFELDECIHRYYSGPRKELYKFFQLQGPVMVVARALALGIIDCNRVSAAVAKEIEPLVETFKE